MTLPQVLGILFAVFVACYLPFFAVYVIKGTCGQPCRPYLPPRVLVALEWVAYSGSMLNPIIYHVFNPDFRRAFDTLLRCGCCRASSRQRQSGTGGLHQVLYTRVFYTKVVYTWVYTRDYTRTYTRQDSGRAGPAAYTRCSIPGCSTPRWLTPRWSTRGSTPGTTPGLTRVETAAERDVLRQWTGGLH